MKTSETGRNGAKKLYTASAAVCLILVLILTLSLPPLTPHEAASESLGDFFKISYDPATFSKTDILRNEPFSVTIHGNATCINDLPLTVWEGRITGNITAVHSVSGHQVILQSTYTVNINPFPLKQGQSTDMTVTVPLQFPASGETGQYSVIAKTVKAEVFVLGNWSDVTEMFPASVVLGTLTYASSSATPVPTATASPTSTPTVTATPGATTSPTVTATPGASVTPAVSPSATATTAAATPVATGTPAANASSLTPDGSTSPAHYGAPIWAAIGLIATLVLAIIILAIMRLQTRLKYAVKSDESLHEDVKNKQV